MNGDSIVRINFGVLGGPTYIGRPNGIAARKKLNIDALEADASKKFIVDIPESTYNINSSYFLGLFGESVRTAGSKEAFFEKFEFETHGKEYKAIERGVQRALITNKGLNVHQ